MKSSKDRSKILLEKFRRYPQEHLQHVELKSTYIIIYSTRHGKITISDDELLIDRHVIPISKIITYTWPEKINPTHDEKCVDFSRFIICYNSSGGETTIILEDIGQASYPLERYIGWAIANGDLPKEN